jgi:hypothetical protein
MSGGLQPGPKYEQVVAEDCWPMKLALALLARLDVPAAEAAAFVLSLTGPAERLCAEVRTAESWPCLFRRGSCRLSLLDDVDDARGR